MLGFLGVEKIRGILGKVLDLEVGKFYKVYSDCGLF